MASSSVKRKLDGESSHSRKRKKAEVKLDEILATLKDADVKDDAAYMSKLNSYREAMNLLLLSDTATLNLIVDEGLLNVIVNHINGPSPLMCRLCCKALMRFQSEEHKRLICDTNVINNIMNALKRNLLVEPTTDVTKAVCIMMDAVGHLADIPESFQINGVVQLFHKSFENSVNIKEKVSALRVLEKLSSHDANSKEIIAIAPNIFLPLVDMLVCKDEEIHRSVFRLIVNLLVFSPDLVNCEGFPTIQIFQLAINLIGNVKTSEDTVTLGLSVIFQIIKKTGEYKSVAQLGLIPLLMQTLKSGNEEIRLYTLGLLWMLGKDFLNQVAIVKGGALMEFINLYGAEDELMRRRIHALLFCLAKNEVIISYFVTEGCVEKLLELQGGVYGDFVLWKLLHLMRESKKPCNKHLRLRIAVALAHFCRPIDFKLIFIDSLGLEFLTESLLSSGQTNHIAMALHKLAIKVLRAMNVQAPPTHNITVENVYAQLKASIVNSDHGVTEACMYFGLRNFRELAMREPFFVEELCEVSRDYLERCILQI
ncbi:hypothetical protein MTR_3g008350 [Medicago truncatula]|uniref:Uncharacterized protein n=1 Tax=Medicago truncatula TaxID=3880 RepID=G7IVM7_MEDTR|nr:hypothetical protein MTR_3g008350 [Medicago truncatula]